MKKRLKKGRASGKEKWLFFLLGLCLMTMALPDTVRAQTNALPNAEEITAGKEETLTVSGSTVSGPVVPAQYMARATARDVVEYQIEVGGVPVTSQNAGNVLEGTDNDGKVSYDPDTGILTLNGADISCNSRGKGSLRSERNDLTVQLLNQNRMEDTSTSAGGVTPGISYVFSGGNLTFCGEGSLEITGQPTITQANGCDLYGIRNGWRLYGKQPQSLHKSGGMCQWGNPHHGRKADSQIRPFLKSSTVCSHYDNKED